MLKKEHLRILQSMPSHRSIDSKKRLQLLEWTPPKHSQRMRSQTSSPQVVAMDSLPNEYLSDQSSLSKRQKSNQAILQVSLRRNLHFWKE